MNRLQVVRDLWLTMDNQDWSKLATYFSKEASIFWPNTNEVFSVTQFVKVNSQYPGTWKINIKKVTETENKIISIVQVSMAEISYHALSFFDFLGDKVSRLEEYWSEDGLPPTWRKEILDNYQK